MTITINTDQRLYGSPCGGVYTCLGFDVCFDHAKELAKRVDRPDLAPNPDDKGTLGQYAQYQDLLRIYATHPANKKTFYVTDKVPPRVIQVLESLIRSGERVHLFKGDADTGEDWLDDFEVVGRIGRSMGPMRVPLLIEEGEDCGGPILCDCILRIQRLADGKDLYRHANYTPPEIQLSSSKERGYAAAAICDGKTQANFKTWEEAERWQAFMLGNSPWRPS